MGIGIATGNASPPYDLAGDLFGRPTNEALSEHKIQVAAK